MVRPLEFLRRRRQRRSALFAAYRQIVERSRDPALFRAWGVPDTLDGRFEVLALHAFLVLNRLKGEPGAAAGFAQGLFDTMFADLDGALREMGVSDLGVGPRIKAMARGFYGRIAAYEQGLGDEAALAAALRRNLFGTTAPSGPQLAAAVGYAQRQAQALAAAPLAALLGGAVAFAPVEAAAAPDAPEATPSHGPASGAIAAGAALAKPGGKG
jgi:cytochrome b pre-mRNA-processing protein 3